MILFIDSSDFNKVRFAAVDNHQLREKIVTIDSHESFKLLAHLEKFLRSQKIGTTPPSIPPLRRGGKGKWITKIVANKGPGSYTGVRIGVVTAQALGFAWDVPVKFLAANKIPKNLKKLSSN